MNSPIRAHRSAVIACVALLIVVGYPATAPATMDTGDPPIIISNPICNTVPAGQYFKPGEHITFTASMCDFDVLDDEPMMMRDRITLVQWQFRCVSTNSGWGYVAQHTGYDFSQDSVETSFGFHGDYVIRAGANDAGMYYNDPFKVSGPSQLIKVRCVDYVVVTLSKKIVEKEHTAGFTAKAYCDAPDLQRTDDDTWMQDADFVWRVIPLPWHGQPGDGFLDDIHCRSTEGLVLGRRYRNRDWLL